MIDHHISNLRTRHERLKAALHEELKRVAPDESRVRRLKRSKLRVKDRIAGIERATAPIPFVF